jgi:transposase
MNEDWLFDGRKIPEEVMSYFRKRAVQAVRKQGHSPEVVAAVMGFSRSCTYTWLNRYDQGGYPALESRLPTGAEAVITPAIEAWLQETVLNSTPVAHGYDTLLWTRDILAELVQQQFGVTVSGVSVSLHLSMVTAAGKLHYTVTAATVDSEQYIHFLRQLLHGRTRPLILLVDRASFHHSQPVREFVCALGLFSSCLLPGTPL